MRAAFVAAALCLTLAHGSGAQSSTKAPADVAPVPFGVGEKMTYKVALGIVGEVGTGALEVVDIDTVHGHPSYELRFRINGGVPFAHVDDDYRSWLDVQSLISRRFKQDQHEVRYERHRMFDFLPEQRIWKRIDGKNESGPMPTELPLDDVSFLYFIRTLPLEVGRTYSFNRYFHADGNPVTVKVLRKQKVVTPHAGTFNTIVVQPIIKSKGLFSEGGQAEVYFSDDSRRILVAIHSKVKILRTLDAVLETYSPGQRLSTVEP
jgi:hypothetical protein